MRAEIATTTLTRLNMKRSRSTERQRRHQRERLRIEALEKRELLTASNVFGQHYGVVGGPFEATAFNLAVDASSFTLAGGDTQVGFRVKALGDEILDPGVVSIRTAGGQVVIPKLAIADLSGGTESLTIATLTPGDYRIEVRAERGTTGVFVVDTFLVGDTNGDFVVDPADINQIRQSFGARRGSSSYKAEADANQDGVINSLDLSYAVQNNGDATSLRIERPNVVYWDGGAGTLNWNDPLNWSLDVRPTANDHVIVPFTTPSPIVLAGAGASAFSVSSMAAIAVSNTSLTVSKSTHIAAPLDIAGVSASATLNGLTSAQEMSLRDGALLTHGVGVLSGLQVTVSERIIVDALSRIDVNGRGYAAQTGPGAGTAGGVGSAGASHGGRGGNGYSGSGGGGIAGPTYGSLSEPIALGSGGGSQRGGGAIRLNVGGELIVDGSIAANGVSGSGAGAGGSIFITTDSWSGAGSITANGGSFVSGAYGNGGGGGGRIAVYYEQKDFLGTVLARGGSGVVGGAGTIYEKRSSDTLATIRIDNGGATAGGTEIVGAQTWAANVVITGMARLVPVTLQPLDLTILGYLQIDTNGSIDADGRGYGANAGPGRGWSDGVVGRGGGGYGGAGGGGSLGGSTYGSSVAPLDFGSGGADGGRGGGAIKLTISQYLQLDGTIRANGLQGRSGGSGGSIYIITGAWSGAGLISANGGSRDSGPYPGGAGGGGRIAIYYGISNFTGVVTAANGFPGSGQPGTTHFSGGAAAQNDSFSAAPLTASALPAGKEEQQVPIGNLQTVQTLHEAQGRLAQPVRSLLEHMHRIAASVRISNASRDAVYSSLEDWLSEDNASQLLLKTNQSVLRVSGIRKPA
ncbi:MAG: hypothetical protein KF708_07800 [Pirellulales bacterium]|nr:hypothetical protein [Pirellulales bacterium]